MLKRPDLEEGSSGRASAAQSFIVRSLKTIMKDGERKLEAERRAANERVKSRIGHLASLSDEDLIAEAPARTPVAFPWHEMEMQRRLKVAITALTAESRQARWWAFWGTIAIGLLTVVLIALTIVLAVNG